MSEQSKTMSEQSNSRYVGKAGAQSEFLERAIPPAHGIAAAKQASIPAAMGRLNVAMNSLYPVIERLEEQLRPALSDPGPHTGMNTPPQPFTCGLEDWINSKTAELLANIEHLEAIARRLEL